MRKADEIVQVLDDIPTKQVGGRGAEKGTGAENVTGAIVFGTRFAAPFVSGAEGHEG